MTPFRWISLFGLILLGAAVWTVLPLLDRGAAGASLLLTLDLLALMAALVVGLFAPGISRQSKSGAVTGSMLLLAGSAVLLLRPTLHAEARVIWAAGGIPLALVSLLTQRDRRRWLHGSPWLLGLALLIAPPIALSLGTFPWSTVVLSTKLLLLAPVLIWTACLTMLVVAAPLRYPSIISRILFSFYALAAWLLALGAGYRAYIGMSIPFSPWLTGPSTALTLEIVGHWLIVGGRGLAVLFILTLPHQRNRSVQDASPSTTSLMDRIFQGSRDAILVLDSRGLISSVSPAMEELSGYELRHWESGETLDSYIHEDDLEIFSSAFQTAMTGSGPPLIKSRFRRRDGTYLWVEQAMGALSWDEEQPVDVVVSLRNIDHLVHQEDDLHQRIRELEIYNSIATTAASTMNIDRIVNSAADRLISLAKLDAVAILLREPSSPGLRLATSRGLSSEVLTALQTEEERWFRWENVEEAVPLFEEDYQDSSLASPALLEAGITTLAELPLQFRTRLQGVLLCGHRQPQPMTAGKRHLLVGVSNQLVVALHNARIMQRFALRERQAVALGELSNVSRTREDVGEFWAKVRQLVLDFFGLPQARIYQVEPQGRELRLVAGAGLEAEISEGGVLRPEQTAWMDHVLPGATPWECDPETSGSLGLKTGLMIPVTTKERPEAMLLVGDHLRARKFSAEELEMATMLSQHVALSWERLRLQGELRREKENYQRLSRLAAGRERRIRELKERLLRCRASPPGSA